MHLAHQQRRNQQIDDNGKDVLYDGGEWAASECWISPLGAFRLSVTTPSATTVVIPMLIPRSGEPSAHLLPDEVLNGER
jgi:hypothetical protein